MTLIHLDERRPLATTYLGGEDREATTIKVCKQVLGLDFDILPDEVGL